MIKKCSKVTVFKYLGYLGGITSLTCPGDSGSPLVVHNSREGPFVQVGIASEGTCQSLTDPAIFARVEDEDTFQFIKKQSQDHKSPPEITDIEKLTAENLILSKKYIELENKVSNIVELMVSNKAFRTAPFLLINGWIGKM